VIYKVPYVHHACTYSKTYNSHSPASGVHMVCRYIWRPQSTVFLPEVNKNKSQVVGQEYPNTQWDETLKRIHQVQVPKYHPSVKSERVNLSGFPNSTKNKGLAICGSSAKSNAYLPMCCPQTSIKKFRPPALNSMYPL